MPRRGTWLVMSLMLLAFAFLLWPIAGRGGAPLLSARQPLPASTALPDVEAALLSELQRQTGGSVRVSRHDTTGKVRYLGADAEHPVPRPADLDADAEPEEAARAFLNVYGSLFGLNDPARELTLLRVQEADRGRTFVRFQQLYRGVPVLGGEWIVQLDAARNVVSANGELLPAPGLDVTPAILPPAARQSALDLAARVHGVAADELLASPPELWIYSPALLGTLGLPINALVWRTEVRSRGLAPIRELVLVEAHWGGVLLHFNQIETAKTRRIYDNRQDPTAGLPGRGPVRSEGQGATGIADVDNAYEYTGDTYDYYRNNHARDSLDGLGLPLISTVRYCAPTSEQMPCPYPNAFWNGEQMVFGTGYASSDDVVAHELTHGVTSHECNLFYYFQSGAINESLSDILGEFVDLTNGKGNDTAGVRWLMGEDLPDGAIRNMADPPQFQHPDRMTSALYYYTTNPNDSDEGGVHENSGVGNKAAYLMTDGDTFNGVTVRGLGIAKVSKIYYEASVHLLTSASDYADLYDLLPQAATNLIGTAGITAADVQQVRNAVRATEMNLQPGVCPANEAPICDGGQGGSDLFYDNFENVSSGKWVTGTSVGECAWYYPPPDWLTYATSGDHNLLGWDVPSRSQSFIKMTADVSIPQGVNAYMHFRHAYQFDAYVEQGSYFDGGLVVYSTDGGASWRDAGGLFVENGYNGTLFAQGDNPLKGWQAFGAESCGYISSRLDLSSLAGQRVRFAFIVATDKENLLSFYGWFIDDVRIYTCGGAHATSTPTRTPTQHATPTRTPTARPFTPTAWVRLPVILKDSAPEPGPTPSDTPTLMPGQTRTPTRTAVPGQTPTPTRTTVPGPTPTGVPDHGGPDAFGYTWTRQVDMNWIDATDGAVVPAGSKGPFNIGFPFQFYGTTYNQFYLNTAMLQFGRSDSWSLLNVCIPSASPPNSFAAAFWGCVGFYQMSSHTYLKTVGTSPNRALVAEVHGLQHCNEGGLMVLEIVLLEGSNDIVFQYQALSTNSHGDARDVTIGIENPTGRNGLQVSCNQPWLYDGAAVRFSYPR